MIFLSQDIRRYCLGIGTVIADLHPVRVLRQTMLYQRIMITVISVLGDFQIHRRAVEGNLLAARINHVGNGSKGTHIVIYHHSRAVHARTYSIIEDERHPILQQFFEMIILLGILRL